MQGHSFRVEIKDGGEGMVRARPRFLSSARRKDAFRTRRHIKRNVYIFANLAACSTSGETNRFVLLFLSSH